MENNSKGDFCVIPDEEKKTVIITKDDAVIELSKEKAGLLADIILYHIQEWDDEKNVKAAPMEGTKERRRKIMCEMASNFGKVESCFCLRCV